MAGYSGTPLEQKLGIKPGHVVAVLNAPDGFSLDVETRADLRRKRYDVILFFAKRASELRGRFEALRAKLDDAGGLWIAWPKKSSGVLTDLDFDAVQNTGLGHGLVDNKICAVDDTWSGLRFVVRLKDRAR